MRRAAIREPLAQRVRLEIRVLCWFRRSSGCNRFAATTTYATQDGIGAGEENTPLIASRIIPGTLSANSYANIAAGLCATYTALYTGAACSAGPTSGAQAPASAETCYGDWYLPSTVELNLLYLKRPRLILLEMVGRRSLVLTGVPLKMLRLKLGRKI